MKVIDLIRYNHIVRGLYFDSLEGFPWSEVVASNGLSFDSVRNVFLHLTLVEDRWISYVIPGRFKDWVDPDFDAFKNMDALKKYMLHVKENTESYLGMLSVEELDRQIAVPWGDKPYSEVNVETILHHLVMEDMIHYGKLSTVLWQIGLEAPYMGFWRYKHQHP